MFLKLSETQTLVTPDFFISSFQIFFSFYLKIFFIFF